MAEGTISQETADPAPKPDELFSSVIPEPYREKPYLKDIASMKKGPEAYEALFKKFDGAQAVLGKKSGIPAPDAPAEEWSEFYGKLRPETPDAYEFKVPDGQTPDEEFVKTMKSVFHKAGLAKNQANQVNEGFLTAIQAKQAAAAKAAEETEKEFEELTKATFAEDNKAVLDTVQVALKEYTPDNLKGHIEKLPNKELVILSGVIHNILKKYVPEAELNNKNPNNDSAATMADLREEGKRLMMTPAYKDAFHKDHAKVVKQVNDIYAKFK